jgi:hypothetical protein
LQPEIKPKNNPFWPHETHCRSEFQSLKKIK